ncbi:MAG: hypothetical protein KGZ25_03285 [Planctomycetes bacterium]|nr:hypothetical protein [Planctomycetota bacterium]
MKAEDIPDYAKKIRQDCERWVKSMRCPNKPFGYFRYSEHAYHPWCLYASNQALAVWNRLGLVDELSEGQRQQWASVFFGPL